MRIAFLSSFVLALLVSVSGVVSAAPAVKAEAPEMVQVAPAMQAEKVNVNTADAQTLQRELSGIGATKAQAIVAYREANGAFASVDELLEVKGIGKTLLDRNRDKVAVN